MVDLAMSTPLFYFWEDFNMKKKLFSKSAAALFMCGLCALSFAGCGASGTADVTRTYMVSEATYLDGIAWYSNEDVMLVTRGKDSYELYFKRDIFGTTDPGMKGEKTIVYFGTYTSTPSADGDVSHLDLTLSAPTRIYMEQHGKAFGRDALAGNLMFDTANWTDAMTTLAFPAGSEDGAKEFLSLYGREMTITVEDPSLSAEDTTLSYRIVSMPEESLEITGNA